MKIVFDSEMNIKDHDNLIRDNNCFFLFSFQKIAGLVYFVYVCLGGLSTE